MKENFEGTPRPQEKVKIAEVDSIDSIKALPDRSLFNYKGTLYHKLNASFAVKAKIEGNKVLGNGTAFAIDDIEKNDK